MTAGGYRYRGTLPDAPARKKPGWRRVPLIRKSPGLRPASMSSRVMEALANLGGEASTTEIRAALAASGTVLPAPRRVPDALHRLAGMTPPRVTAVGDPVGGWGKAQRWRLGGGA
jgi:hypothetical protein